MSAEDHRWQDLFQEMLETPGDSAGAVETRYEMPDGLNEMLLLTQQLQELGRRQMPDADAALARARERVLQSIPASAPERRFALPTIRPPFWRQWRAALSAAMIWTPTPLLAALTIALVFGITIFVAGNARPGSPLYPIRVTADEIMQRLAPSESGDGRQTVAQIAPTSSTEQPPEPTAGVIAGAMLEDESSPTPQSPVVVQTPDDAGAGNSPVAGEEQQPARQKHTTPALTPTRPPARRTATTVASPVIVAITPPSSSTAVADGGGASSPTPSSHIIATGGIAPTMTPPTIVMTATAKSTAVVAGAVISKTAVPTNTVVPTVAVTESPTLMPIATNSPTSSPVNTPAFTPNPPVFVTLTPTPTRRPTQTPAPTRAPTKARPTRAATFTPASTRRPTRTPVSTSAPTRVRPTSAPTVTPAKKRPTQPPEFVTVTPTPAGVSANSDGTPVSPRQATPQATTKPRATATPASKFKSISGVIGRVWKSHGRVVGFYINRRYVRVTAETAIKGQIVPGKKATVKYYFRKRRRYAVSVVVKGASTVSDSRLEAKTAAGVIGRVRKKRGKVVGFFISGRYIRVTEKTVVKGKIASRKKAVVKYYTKNKRHYAVEVIVGSAKRAPADKTPTPKPRVAKPTPTPKPSAPKPTPKPRPTSAPVRRPATTPAG